MYVVSIFKEYIICKERRFPIAINNDEYSS